MLKGRVALVTGASRGIGAATAKLLAAHGAKVVVNYVTHEQAAAGVVRAIVEHDGVAAAMQADVRVKEQVDRMVRETESTFGPIDTLVINAGFQFKTGPFLDFTWEEFELKLAGELKGAFFPCQAVVPGMIERKRGCILAVSSGLSRHPGPGFIAHSTAKSGLDAFVKSLAHELGPHGIRVNTIAPGLTETDAVAWLPQEHKQRMAAMTPLRRIGLPDDVAGAILMLASDHAKFVTGTYLPVSGGNQML